jgi:hypothetical protein
LLLVFGLSLGDTSRLAAQTLAADRFLELASPHPVWNGVELDQYLATSNALALASPTEIARVLPSVLEHTRSGNEAHLRAYAAGLLVAISLRQDRVEVLYSSSAEISSLLTDSDPVIQRAAVEVTNLVIGRPGTNSQPYMSALIAGIQNPTTPECIGVAMSMALLGGFGAVDPKGVMAVLTFFSRKDLTIVTRIRIMRPPPFGAPDLPEEVGQLLTKGMDDPDARVRTTAVTTFANSYRRYHHLATDRVERMANDPQEDPQVRQLAKDALKSER